MRRRKGFHTTCVGMFLLAATTLAISTAAYAQVTTGTIEGSATDQAGEPLAGVSIVARSLETGREIPVLSNASGRYRFLGLTPGTYTLEVSIPGFAAPPRQLTVLLGQTAVADFEIRPRIDETVVVETAAPLLNTTKSELTTVLTAGQIAAYPQLNRDFTDLAAYAPGVRQTATGAFSPAIQQGVKTPFTTGGTSGRNLNMSIDGSDNTNTVGGFFAMGFPADGIAEFEVVQDQHKAEYGRTSGAVINVITRSGANDLAGTAFGLLRGDGLRARSFSEELADVDKQESNRYQLGGSIGGRIVRDSLFYFVAGELQRESSPIALSPSLTRFSGTEPEGFPFAIAARGSSFPQDFERDLVSGKLTWHASSEHLAAFRFAMDRVDSINDRGSAFTDPSANGSNLVDGWSLVGNWQWRVGSDMFNDLTASWFKQDNVIATTSPDPGLTVVFDNFALGRNFATPQFGAENRLYVRDDLTWISGDHLLKAGFEGAFIDHESGGQHIGPTVAFNYAGGILPADTMVSGDTGATPGTAVNGVDDGVDILSLVSFSSPRLTVGKYSRLGFYLQDDWQLNDRLTLNLGMRVDTELGVWDAEEEPNRSFYECLADPTSNLKCGRDPATINPPMGVPDYEKTFPQDPLNFSPRVGVLYALGADQRDVVRGSWGLYYDQVLSNIASFNWANQCPDCFPGLPFLPGCGALGLGNCAGATQLTAGSVVAPGVPPLPNDLTLNNWVNDPRLRSWLDSLAATQGPATLAGVFPFSNLVSPDWKSPFTSSLSFGWGREITRDLVLDANFIWRRGFRQLRNESLAGRNSGRQAPFPVRKDLETGADVYDGALNIFQTDGKTDYLTLQLSLRGRFRSFDFGANVNVSRARGTQDNAGTAQFTADSGPFDIFEGGNIRFTGGSIDAEWGRISGDQRVYAFLYGMYRFAHGVHVAGQMAYGSRVAVHPFAGADLNGDGFATWFVFNDEYGGERGGEYGDSLVNVNLRLSKLFRFNRGTSVEAFGDLYNLFNRRNSGAFVIHRQFIQGQTIATNPEFLRPVGNTMTPPFTMQLGLRFSF